LVKFPVNPLTTSIRVAGRARARLADFRLPLPRGRTTQNHTRHIDTYALTFVRTRNGENAPVSTREAVQALRAVYPDCPMSDRELADKIAKLALAHGLPVIFDCGNAPVRERHAQSLPVNGKPPAGSSDPVRTHED
jgi:hypothetical protein